MRYRINAASAYNELMVINIRRNSSYKLGSFFDPFIFLRFGLPHANKSILATITQPRQHATEDPT